MFYRGGKLWQTDIGGGRKNGDKTWRRLEGLEGGEAKGANAWRFGGLKDWREGKCFATQKLSHFGLEDWREGRQKVQMLGGLEGGENALQLKNCQIF